LVIEADNRVDDSAGRRGLGTLPLKENDWNDAELLIANDQVQIRLNGELIVERAIEPTCDRRFGVFHFKAQTAVEVREVVLTGDWPQSLPATQADLSALAPHAASEAVVRARHRLVSENVLSDEAYAVWLRAVKLSGAERYAALKEWVMPSASHAAVRLALDWTPLDSQGRRDSRGGELVSPALELIATAKELGKLEELATAAAIARKEYPEQARALNALEALLAIARGDAEVATDRLTKAIDLVKGQPAETPLAERYGEYLAAYAARTLPAVRPVGLKLAQEIVADQRAPRVVSAEWSRRTPRLRAMLTWATDKTTPDLPFGGGPGLNQWHSVMRATAKDHGEGFGPAVWKMGAGEATYMTVVGYDGLYFAVPLRGDFEVSAQVTTAANRGVR